MRKRCTTMPTMSWQSSIGRRSRLARVSGTGRLLRRISGPQNVINHLAYSPDRHWLAGSFGGENGTRLFEAASGHETGQDGDYGDTSQRPTAA